MNQSLHSVTGLFKRTFSEWLVLVVYLCIGLHSFGCLFQASSHNHNVNVSDDLQIKYVINVKALDFPEEELLGFVCSQLQQGKFALYSKRPMFSHIW